MDTKKLNKWAELLLDTGKRNNLINFKDTKNTTVDILLPTIDVLFDKITGTTTFEVFDVQYTETDEENNVCNESVEEQKMLDKKTAYLSRYSAKIKKQKQMLLKIIIRKRGCMLSIWLSDLFAGKRTMHPKMCCGRLFCLCRFN